MYMLYVWKFKISDIIITYPILIQVSSKMLIVMA